MSKPDSTLTAIRLRELLDYDPATGIFTWIDDRGCGKMKAIAGWRTQKGYWAISIDDRSHLAHRLAWLFMTGNFPVLQIDHANRVKADNRFLNLREASNSENMRNTTANKRNKSGHRGVSLNKSTGKWVAKCMADGRQHHLGYYNAVEDAAEAYRAFAQERHGKFFPVPSPAL